MLIDNYTKVDFHIHTYASKTKVGDIEKTKDNTFENIDVLFEKMNNSKVNLFSFTDHNTFDYELYSKTKAYIDHPEFPYEHIMNILPGVEFDLDFDDNNNRTHATCIFNDVDQSKLRDIENIVKNQVNGRNYNEIKFSEDDLNTILHKIQLDFILIVHQKTDIQNENVHGDNDFSRLDSGVRERLMYCDYFTLYESNQHLFRFRFEDLKSKLSYSANFITGTDCHTWSEYPDNTTPDSSFDFTYIKTDYTFTGMKIAVTGNGERRILSKLPISSEKIYDCIKYTINGVEKNIPLSNGINAVIGGNTSGKSLMLAKIFNEIDSNKNGMNFLAQWKLNFLDANIIPNKLEYTKQGDVRKIFEDGGTGLVSKFSELFKSIDYTVHFETIKNIAEMVLSVAKRNSREEELYKSIDCIIGIPNYDDVTYYPLVTPLPIKPKNPTKAIMSKYDKINNLIVEISSLIDEDDKTAISNIKRNLSTLIEKYNIRNENELMSIQMYTSFISAKDDYLKYIQDKSITVTEMELLQYDKVVNDFLDDIDEIIELKLTDRKDLNESINEFSIDAIATQKGELSYITSPKVSEYSSLLQKKILLSAFKQDRDFNFTKDINSINIKYFIDNLRRDTSETIDKMNYYQKYLTLLEVELRKNYFNDEFKVLDKDEPIQDTKSPGNNAIYYIKTKAELLNNKLVVFDQPEDDVAPEKIRTDLIKSISKIAVSNQVIIVTHNPQLVVNLDVDNVICLDDTSEEFKIHHGPLYLKSETDILQMIADKLDGGKKALKERWRRYE